jgi:hypothetical protein
MDQSLQIQILATVAHAYSGVKYTTTGHSVGVWLEVLEEEVENYLVWWVRLDLGSPIGVAMVQVDTVHPDAMDLELALLLWDE